MGLRWRRIGWDCFFFIVLIEQQPNEKHMDFGLPPSFVWPLNVQQGVTGEHNPQRSSPNLEEGYKLNDGEREKGIKIYGVTAGSVMDRGKAEGITGVSFRPGIPSICDDDDDVLLLFLFATLVRWVKGGIGFRCRFRPFEPFFWKRGMAAALGSVGGLFFIWGEEENWGRVSMVSGGMLYVLLVIDIGNMYG
ncbi:hypothetical protein CCUS01_16798 [Colletotrichum cuscutae]|uniref:Uncharacterized protein n=1 Tax=Colletotrichum cuscutae TaxID=1209917 RepID=A0AAI9V8B7_9PEZI|nr:hypothetical protein CCUS01_16798 [Colletotrichum cuscutae]